MASSVVSIRRAGSSLCVRYVMAKYGLPTEALWPRRQGLITP